MSCSSVSFQQLNVTIISSAVLVSCTEDIIQSSYFYSHVKVAQTVKIDYPDAVA